MADLIDQPLPGFGSDGPAGGPRDGAGDVDLPTAKIVPFPVRRVIETDTDDAFDSDSDIGFATARTAMASVDGRSEAAMTQASMDAHPATGRPATSGPRRPGPRATPSAPRRAKDIPPERSAPVVSSTPAAPGKPSVPTDATNEPSTDSRARTARSNGRSARHRVRRPGSVGGVVVRAPMLDPTRRPVGPTPARRLLGSKAPDAAPHPRVAKRLDDVRRSHRKRTFRPALALGAAGVLVVAVALIVLFSPIFEVTRVDVAFQGTSAQSTDLAAVVRPVRGQNIVRLDLADTKRSIAAMPWVARVSVSRGLPHTVRISVVAHDVAGAVKLANDRFAITASDATVLKVVEANDATLDGLPTIDLGLAAIPVAGDRLAGSAADVLASASSVEHRFPGQLRSVSLVDGEVEWMVRPQPGAKAIRVRVGAPTSSDVPAAALASVLARTGPAPLGIDLRTPNTPVIQTAAKG